MILPDMIASHNPLKIAHNEHTTFLISLSFHLFRSFVHKFIVVLSDTFHSSEGMVVSERQVECAMTSPVDNRSFHIGTETCIPLPKNSRLLYEIMTNNLNQVTVLVLYISTQVI